MTTSVQGKERPRVEARSSLLLPVVDGEQMEMANYIRISDFARGLLIFAMFCQHRDMHAQERTGWTASLGAGFNMPLGQTANFAHSTGTFTAALGYQWSSHQAVLAQYYVSGLPFKGSPLDQVSSLDPTSNLFSVTANYRHEMLRTNALRPYAIVGSGWYRRVTTFTKPTVAGAIACSPLTGWWGYLCEGGFVPMEKVVAGSTLDALGFNVGGGVSGAIGRGERPRWFVEIRYHYAAHSGAATQTLPITAGLTW